ncbi:MupA/Atu3671 family FMN-dependent luciferase-like monooxygenase [Streptomyces sp. NPDC006385]|uniref:MupA/Atu3671 family FMN-dependent luciferase-like monooxygenase n=1 Tax=Streptomyces sp. NPDC006385 TaxID=3156761 RepID=UPI0033ABA583
MTTTPDIAGRLAALSPQQRALLDKKLRRTAPALGDAPQASAAGPRRRARRADSVMDFMLFFFSGDGTTHGPGKYDFLFDAARYADRNGFSAISVPERHFVDFGGLYPNPSLLAAALAAVTERIQIRAGSVVLPLHHPVRIAEEWSVVDNISGGRTAISCASGWHPDDFVLAPDTSAERFERRREEMFDQLAAIQRLWAGEAVAFPGPFGKPVEVRSLPRPIQPRLPVWVSSQGSVETFVRAGEAGAHVLTGLVAQRLTDLGEKIAAYREARREHGHDPAAGKVSVMVHTFLGADEADVKRIVRQPLIDYLKTFLAQQDGFGSEYAQISGEARDAMLAATFERYYDTIALLGTPDKCETLIEDLVDIGVDEVACLVDFGVDQRAVLDSLDHLTELKDRYRREDGDAA